MALHFSTERPEDQFYTDFGNFNKFGEEVRIQLAIFNKQQPFALFPINEHLPAIFSLYVGFFQAWITHIQLLSGSTAGK